jgi:protein-S-isoprenylcysteine O-methyltransferase Ste14
MPARKQKKNGCRSFYRLLSRSRSWRSSWLLRSTTDSPGRAFLRLVFFVLKENSFAAGAIEVAPDQRVISTGPYAIVRHPMYAGALIMLFGTPLALGSFWSFVPFVLTIGVLVARLLDEETFLAKNLPGYDDYRREVRRRLVPLVW